MIGLLPVVLAQKKPVEVRVLSFSINHGKNYWAESNIREVLKIIEKEKPDLIALQEIDSVVLDARVSFHIRQLAVQTGYHFVYGASGAEEGGTYGVGILSKWPLENTQKLPLPHSAATDARVMVCGLVSPVKGRYFRFCTARLDYSSIFDRALQSAFIHQVLSPSVQPVLLAMDLGARPGEQSQTFFQADWMDAAQTSVEPTLSQGQPGDRFDYLLALKNTDVRVVSYEVLREHATISSHLPVIAVFEFR
ncbi:MAG: endonuclease/exonuclease/phosphatase family protein [Bacteroidetes bacterium]|nr:endonuclease/exonuclease/phosphatase family protein [Bacteroidota bacterium]